VNTSSGYLVSEQAVPSYADEQNSNQVLGAPLAETISLAERQNFGSAGDRCVFALPAWAALRLGPATRDELAQEVDRLDLGARPSDDSHYDYQYYTAPTYRRTQQVIKKKGIMLMTKIKNQARNIDLHPITSASCNSHSDAED
jgi:hypothetical protein